MSWWERALSKVSLKRINYCIGNTLLVLFFILACWVTFTTGVAL